jgi:hypothetical protein
MGKANRSTLKTFFQRGRMPSERQFVDLIDSMLNMVDEGFDKSPEDGLKISQLGENTALISFYHPTDLRRPTWIITCDKTREQLVIRNGSGTPVLILSADGCIGVGQATPRHALDVAGVLAAEGRTGVQGFAPADGKWHSIVDGLHGCQALEVMAGVGKPKTGRYALLRATALNTFHPGGFWTNWLNRKHPIQCRQAYYRSRCDRIMLRWQRSGDAYALGLKTKRPYPEEIRVQYSVTRLWFDEMMAGSLRSPEATTDPPNPQGDRYR